MKSVYLFLFHKRGNDETNVERFSFFVLQTGLDLILKPREITKAQKVDLLLSRV